MGVVLLLAFPASKERAQNSDSKRQSDDDREADEGASCPGHNAVHTCFAIDLDNFREHFRVLGERFARGIGQSLILVAFACRQVVRTDNCRDSDTASDQVPRF